MTFGIVKSGIVQAQSEMNLRPLTTDSLLAVDILPEIGRNLGVAIVNPAGVVNVLTLTLRDPDGTSIASPLVVPLQPQQQLSKFVSELFTNAIGGFKGSMRIQSPMPVSVMGALFTGVNFACIPVAGNLDEAGIPSR